MTSRAPAAMPQVPMWTVTFARPSLSRMVIMAFVLSRILARSWIRSFFCFRHQVSFLPSIDPEIPGPWVPALARFFPLGLASGAASGFWYLFRIGWTFRMVAWPWKSPSIMTTGPMAQQPRQATVSSVNWPSAVVSPGGDVELALELLEDLRPPADMAGRAHADQAGVLSAGREAEGPVERGHADDVDERHLQRAGDLAQRFRREVIVLGLDVQEDRDEVLPEAAVPVDDGRDLLRADGQALPSCQDELSTYGISGKNHANRRECGERTGTGKRVLTVGTASEASSFMMAPDTI